MSKIIIRQFWRIRLWLAHVLDMPRSILCEWHIERAVRAGAGFDPRYVIMLSRLPVIKQREVLERAGIIRVVKTALVGRIIRGQVV